MLPLTRVPLWGCAIFDPQPCKEPFDQPPHGTVCEDGCKQLAKLLGQAGHLGTEICTALMGVPFGFTVGLLGRVLGF